MKKTLLLFITIFMFLTLIACDQNSLTSTITTDNTSQTTVSTNESGLFSQFPDIVFPEYPDDPFFYYAEIILYFSYPAYSHGNPNYSNARHYYESKNIEYFSASELDLLGNYDKRYLSLYSPFVSLTYKSKSAFLEDFEILKASVTEGHVMSMNVSLNTVGHQINITEDTTLADITNLTEKYFNTEIVYDSLEFTILDVSNQYEEYCTFHDFLDVNDTYIIETYQQYINICSSNPLDLNETFFEDKVIIYGRFGHSGSMFINGVSDLFYLDDNTLEVVVSFTAHSLLMTDDWIPYSFVISMNKSDLLNNPISKLHFHGTYLSGYLYDRPFHNSIDD